ncbi:MAG: FHA domain-containing protein [Vicinamibacterales bacterium]
MKRLRLEFLSGPRRGDASVFSARTVTLGRSRSNTFVLPESVAPAASARHAEFRHENGAWWVVDLHSTNGTYVNGQSITRTRVSAGDRVIVGDLELRVGFVDAHASTRLTIGLALVAGVLVLAGIVYWARVVRPGDPRQIANAASESVYAVATEQSGRRTLVGTAFAVTADGLLATNAHVASALGSLNGNEVKAVAIRSDRTEPIAIVRSTLHPEWRAGSIAHDVAVLRLSASTSTVPLTIATGAAVQRLTRGMSLATFGFPAVSTDISHPRGRLSVDVLSDVRLPYLEVGLGIAPGTSGSPVFGPDGEVIALVVSGDFVGGPPGAPARPSGTNVNWAISVDELRPLLSAPSSH